MTDVATRPDAQAQAKAAFDVANRIVENVKRLRTLWIEIAQDLYKFNEFEMWRDLGYMSFEAWLAEPEVELGRRHVYYLLQAWRELVIDRGVEPKELEEIELSKVQEVLPAIRRGQVKPDVALADTKTLTLTDLRERYRQPAGPDNSTHLDATTEPEYAICPACGGRYQVKS